MQCSTYDGDSQDQDKDVPVADDDDSSETEKRANVVQNAAECMLSLGSENV